MKKKIPLQMRMLIGSDWSYPIFFSAFMLVPPVVLWWDWVAFKAHLAGFLLVYLPVAFFHIKNRRALLSSSGIHYRGPRCWWDGIYQFDWNDIKRICLDRDSMYVVVEYRAPGAKNRSYYMNITGRLSRGERKKVYSEIKVYAQKYRICVEETQRAAMINNIFGGVLILMFYIGFLLWNADTYLMKHINKDAPVEIMYLPVAFGVDRENGEFLSRALDSGHLDQVVFLLERGFSLDPTLGTHQIEYQKGESDVAFKIASMLQERGINVELESKD